MGLPGQVEFSCIVRKLESRATLDSENECVVWMEREAPIFNFCAELRSGEESLYKCECGSMTRSERALKGIILFSNVHSQ